MSALSHPNPQAGVFETMLVAHGRPIELEAHLARLAGSLTVLFDEEPPEEARTLVCERASGIELGRLRLTVTHDRAKGLSMGIVTAEIDPELVFPSWGRAVDLRPLVVEGGLGAHKWADRALLDGAPEEEETLLLDSDGTILEASRANVFAAREGTLRTPPTDGRILPGIARYRAIEICRADGIDIREAELRLDDLLQADEVFLTGSVRGVEPVRSIEGLARPLVWEIGERIASGLRRRWLG
jgi:para-aminobenzoate synthetase/4-amino-4-deoxychorismate lyase